MLKMVQDKRRREIVGWLASGVAAIVTGSWALYVHFSAVDATRANISARECSIAVGNNLTARDVTAGDCQSRHD